MQVKIAGTLLFEKPAPVVHFSVTGGEVTSFSKEIMESHRCTKMGQFSETLRKISD